MKAQGQQGRLLLSENLQFKFPFEFNGIVLKQILYGNAWSPKKRIFLRAKKKLFMTQISKFEFLGTRREEVSLKNKYENRNNEIKHKILNKQEPAHRKKRFCVVSMEGNERFQVYQQDSIEIFIVYWFSLTYRNCISLLKSVSTKKYKYFPDSHTTRTATFLQGSERKNV